MVRITTKFVTSLTPSKGDKFYRDETLIGFGVKFTPKGRKSFIAEGRVRGGKTRRITLGQFPAQSVSEARKKARLSIQMMQDGLDPKAEREAAKRREVATSKTLQDVFEEYITTKDLKAKTEYDYRNTLKTVYEGWEDKPIREITRKDCEDAFVKARTLRGLPTATKANRIISAVFRFAMADEIGGERLLKENPATVIKARGYVTRIKPRNKFLTDIEISKLIHFWLTEKDWPSPSGHGVTEQGINYVMLLLCSGLRRGEALRLRWEDVDESRKHFVIHDTKNGTDHYVPISKVISQILERQKADLAKNGKEDCIWVFPSRLKEGHMTEPKSQLDKICTATGVKFRLHDLRRTFATHAQANGAAFELIKKALNHKSQSVTEGYIITQTDTLRPVFDAVADGYHNYYDPDWKIDKLSEAT